MDRVKKAGCVVLDTKNKTIALVYREKQNDYSFPKGHLEEGETLKECAIRELKEETGYSAQSIKLLHKFYTSAGFSNQKIYIYLAENLTSGSQDFDDDEFIETYEIDINEAQNMVIKNDIEEKLPNYNNINYEQEIKLEKQ